MDQVKTKQARPQKPNTKPLSMVEAYQRQWEQLMEDTNRQIDKIRRKSIRPRMMCRHMREEVR
jgi:hypothetical protein